MKRAARRKTKKKANGGTVADLSGGELSGFLHPPLLDGFLLPLDELSERLLDRDVDIAAGRYTQRLLENHHHGIDERWEASVAMRQADTTAHGAMTAVMPAWFVMALAQLRDSGVSEGELRDALRHGPRGVDALLARYGVEVPAI